MDQATQVVVDELVGNAHGNLERVKEIVVNKPDLMNAKASWNETPLEAATQMGNRPIIEFLLNHGAHIDFFTVLVLGRLDDVDRELKQHPDRAQARGIHDLPALYFSAYSEHEELRPALARGVPYIAKPFTADQLTSRVRDILDGRGGMAADAC